MSQDSTENLLTYCRRELGESMRVFTRYGQNVHEPIFTREDIGEEFDEVTREVFRFPLMRMHSAAWEMYNIHTFINEPDVAMCFYGDALFIQFPLSEEEGILVSLDWEGELPEEFLSKCKDILYTSCRQ